MTTTPPTVTVNADTLKQIAADLMRIADALDAMTSAQAPAKKPLRRTAEQLNDIIMGRTKLRLDSL